jgi:hypothetical protein
VSAGDRVPWSGSVYQRGPVGRRGRRLNVTRFRPTITAFPHLVLQPASETVHDRTLSLTVVGHARSPIPPRGGDSSRRLDDQRYDEVRTVSEARAFEMARRLAAEECILAGTSTSPQHRRGDRHRQWTRSRQGGGHCRLRHGTRVPIRSAPCSDGHSVSRRSSNRRPGPVGLSSLTHRATSTVPCPHRHGSRLSRVYHGLDVVHVPRVTSPTAPSDPVYVGSSQRIFMAHGPFWLYQSIKGGRPPALPRR